MSFLLPLGFLGLLALGALILIYIIKPNYQQKFVSSTYVWKLSLKYRKKSIPINRFRNILIFLCQLLILIACALLLARPVIAAEKPDDRPESIAIIDASASMRVANNDITRFERAVMQVRDLAQSLAEKDGLLSVIVADTDAYYLLQRAAAANLSETLELLDGLLPEEGIKCSYGTADMEGAVEIAEAVVNQNPQTEITLYTATTYLDKSGLNVVNVAEADEWNAAILNGEAVLKDNFYVFNAKVGCYGRSEKLTISCNVIGVNGEDKTVTMKKTEAFHNAEPEVNLSFGAEEQIQAGGAQIYSYQSVHIYVEAADSLSDDNSVYIYGGVKPVIKIQYASTAPCLFFQNTFVLLRSFLNASWQVEITEVTKADAIETEGYDFYLFETLMPKKMPTDGVVVIFNPGASDIDGLTMGFSQSVHNIGNNATLAPGAQHPLTDRLDPEEMTISKYREVLYTENFLELLYYQGSPVMLLREETDYTHIVFSFDVHNSNLPVVMEFPLMFISMFNRYIPATVASYMFEVGSEITLNARGTELGLDGPNVKETINVFPERLKAEMPGSYTLTQTVRDQLIIEQFFVCVPAFESNIAKEVDALPLLERTKKQEYVDADLLIYFAAALVALLFAEWWLQSRENLR